MARFRGTVQGSHGIASRLGSSGLTVQANAWDSGVTVIAGVTDDDDECFEIYATLGSNDPTTRKLLAVVTDGDITWSGGEGR